jgi:hypothetical protein
MMRALGEIPKDNLCMTQDGILIMALGYPCWPMAGRTVMDILTSFEMRLGADTCVDDLQES